MSDPALGVRVQWHGIHRGPFHWFFFFGGGISRKALLIIPLAAIKLRAILSASKVRGHSLLRNQPWCTRRERPGGPRPSEGRKGGATLPHDALPEIGKEQPSHNADIRYFPRQEFCTMNFIRQLVQSNNADQSRYVLHQYSIS